MAKILIINNGLNIGGIQMSSISSANFFVNQGHIVILATLYKLAHEITVDDKVRIYEPKFSRGNKLVFLIRLVRYLRKIAKNEEPDVIISHGEWTNAFVYCVLKDFGIPIYLQDHMNPDNIKKGNKFRLVLNRYAYKRANGVIALSDYSKEIIGKYYGNKNIAVIPNPVRDIPVTKGNEENSVVCIGRMSKEKGHRYLIEAFNELKEMGWQLDIVGDGPEMGNVKKIVLLDNLVKFHGFQKDVTPYLAKAKIFVLPSLSECFPLALIEAMSVGKACVSTDCMSGKGTIINNGINGILVPPGDSKSMANAIKKLIEDENLRNKLGENARQIKVQLSPQKVYTQYLNFILQNITNERYN